ncbi:adhesion G protein-coupled receptor G3-like [Eucyclogobius newberryi]|uniref:adhesion G protein-coupled receptor G3-like n=1 Tax=Eucyclogobius newberryi TaxID=166745 RepID=UPI003B595CB0
MWSSISLTVILGFLTEATATKYCENALLDCPPGRGFSSCYDQTIRECFQKAKVKNPKFYLQTLEPTKEANVPMGKHRVHIPSTALKMSQGEEQYVRVVVTMLDSSYFKPTSTKAVVKSGFILDKSVLVVTAGTRHVQNLTEPVKLLFRPREENDTKQVAITNGQSAACVFWKDSDDGESGDWSTDGCSTHYNGTDYICSCNHLSFFAILVNPTIKVDKKNALNLTKISYGGSALSILFTLISFFLYIRLHRRRPEKALGIHIQLAGAMLLLHQSFLVSSLFLWYNPETASGGLCKAFGLILHWSLLATFSWAALEGFHLYLLLIRVFNIYVRRYVLKISLFGWGFPTLVVAICLTAGVYGKYEANLTDADNQTAIGQMCWISSDAPHGLIASFVTTVAFPCLVVVYNGFMLGRVVCQLWDLRRADYGMEGNRNWKELQKERMTRLWKDAVTVLGLTCLLGLPWGLASLTYISTAGIYVFSVFNALQGFLLFLWCLALRSKSKSKNNSSVRDQLSSQKIINTSV